ncbi:1,5-anhydro-D-fructose reductase-like [Chrysoperla carnea]|uniref:1,5-anhydro-D-fructose reductase-like n=1 Tax=Chrysoperla carnea TaxID=189513 RepID=UPI001D095866|nr:1,5-anhydro-D-fructose reductase-like [Chrysoperla carnea]XP_044731329.1 1,5-anhydro-D-fructose reductase-like [Chrysoperla carnea]
MIKRSKLFKDFQMPIIGLGTWQATDEIIANAIQTALSVGYRHIDTAFNYNNETVIGDTLKKWFDQGHKREELFITTKLPHIGNRPCDVSKFLNLSLEKLKLDYIDLYLIHIPFGFYYDNTTLTPAIDENGYYVLDKETDHLAVWETLEKEVARGRIRFLGLSNFNETQIKNVFNNAKEIKPAVLQIELHAYLQQVNLRNLCEELGIVVTAYSPLGSPGAKEHFVNKYKYSPETFPDLLGLQIVKEISSKYNKSLGQILLKHLIQQGIVIIPKSGNANRIKENFDIFDFELSIDDINELNKLDRGEEGRIFNFLFWKGVENHPQYPFKLPEKN